MRSYCSTIFRLGPIFGKKLCDFLMSLLCKAVYFPVTSSTLNVTSLMPQTDERGLLIGGPLQLSSHTHLLLDETDLRSRQLTSQVRISFKNLFCNQRVFTTLAETQGY